MWAVGMADRRGGRIAATQRSDRHVEYAMLGTHVVVCGVSSQRRKFGSLAPWLLGDLGAWVADTGRKSISKTIQILSTEAELTDQYDCLPA